MSEKKHSMLDDFSYPSVDEWRQEVDKLLKGAPYEKIMNTKTYEDIELKGIYRLSDLETLPHTNSLPGEFPYVRGTFSGGYITNPWKIAQNIDCNSPDEFNHLIKRDLEKGQTAININFDSASSLGKDSDQSEENEVGNNGLTISTFNDFENVLKDINPEKIPVHINSGTGALFASALLNAFCKKNGYSSSQITGSISFDPLSELISNGSLPSSLENLYNEMSIILKNNLENFPKLKTISISANIYQNAGASSVQELSFAMATAVEYINKMVEKGFGINEIATKIRFSFALGSNFFMEIAKLRAAKMVWAEIIKEFSGNEESQKIDIHCVNSKFNKSKYDPYVNMLRTTTEAFSGVLGGCNSMSTSPFDEVIGKSDEFSRRIARNQQIILKEECHFNTLIDPVGGSWYIENLTAQVAEKSWSIFAEIEKQGGMLSVIKNGWINEQVKNIAKLKEKNIATRKDKIVGVNMYPNLQEKPIVKDGDEKELFAKRKKYLQNFRTSGDTAKHIEPLEKLSQVLEAGAKNIFEKITDAFLSSATIGEICKTVRKENNYSVNIEPLHFFRIADKFEQLRENMKCYQNNGNSVHQVYLANIGSIKDYKGRADFSSGFFQVGGFEIVNGKPCSTSEDAAILAIKSNSPVIVICSADKLYPEIVPTFVKSVKASNPNAVIILAGFPKEQIEQHKKNGVDEFIHVRANAYEILFDLQKKLGVTK